MSRRLLSGRSGLMRVIAPFVAVVVAQALIAGFSIYTLSAVRGYVGGESFWSKGQKEAVYFLSLYAETGNDVYYQRYSAAIAVPLADREARLALQADTPDLATARTGFAGGGNHDADIGGMIWLFRNFSEIGYLKRSIEHWTAADPRIVELYGLGTRIHSELTAGPASPAQVAAWKQQIFDLNEKIRPLARDFSISLGEGSRFIKNMLITLNVAAAALLILLGVWRMRKLLIERLAFERALTAERERAEITLASIGDAVVTTDIGGRVDYLNPAAETLLGIAAGAAHGQRLKTVVRITETATGEDDLRRVAAMLAGQGHDRRLNDRMLLRADGQPVPVSVMGAPLLLADEVAGGVLVLADMTREQEYVARLSWQASHDMLTGLANRREFEQQLETVLEGIASGGQQHALMYLDLDQFKLVNDTCGHAAGDQLLKQISAALLKHLPPAGLLSRLGGDEFGVVLEDCAPQTAAGIAEGLRLAVQNLNFCWNGRPFNTTVSIGLVELSDPTLTLEEATGAADVACYMAKDKGRNRIQIHRPRDSDLQRRVDEMAWVQRIHDALEEQRFCLYAQPIVPLGGAEDGGEHIEVLLRLREKSGEMIPPGSFIPAAERYGLMTLLDRWVVRTAFATLAARREPVAICAINLSGATLSDETFGAYVREQFGIHGLSPSTVCFEITETAAIADMDSAIRFITALKAEGCLFALDDFGAGMSSLGYLKHLPVDFLKIDGGFVRSMLTDPSDRAMVEMIDTIGKVMDKRTIAEFVENDAVVSMLTEIGVDYAQGYGIAEPAPFTRNSAPHRRFADSRRRGAA